MNTRRRIRPRKLLLTSLLVAFIALNGVAWMQAWAMTHYAPAGQRTAAIEALSPPEKAWIVLTGVSNPRPRTPSRLVTWASIMKRTPLKWTEAALWKSQVAAFLAQVTE